MKTLYSDIWKKMGKLLGKGGRNRGERYIIENYCLHGGEQILYECEGSIQKKKPLRKPYIKLSVSSGIIFITTQRIIAQGKLAVKELVQARKAILPEFTGWDRHKEYRREKKFLFEASELCFGYVFPVKNLSLLQRTQRGLSYNLVDGKTSITAKKEPIDKQIQILGGEDKNITMEFSALFNLTTIVLDTRGNPINGANVILIRENSYSISQ